MPIFDAFNKHSRSLTSPPENAAAIVADDEGALSHATRALYVGGQGDLRVQMLGGGNVVLSNLPAGSLMPLRVTQVFATGTTATGIVGLW